MSETITNQPEPVNGGVKEAEGVELWSSSLFGCFTNPFLCCCTFILPCYTIGKNAQHFGDPGLVLALFYALGFYSMHPVLRWRIRQQQNIKGCLLTDVLVTMLCPCCALIQENKQIYGVYGSHAGEKLPLKDDILRE